MKDRPTHFVFVKGEDAPHIVYPDGYKGARELPDGFWDCGPWRWEGDEQTGAWVGDVEQRRDYFWQAEKRRRQQVQSEPIKTPFGPLAADEKSLGDLNRAWGHALADPDNFHREWTMADNSIVVLEHATIKALMIAAGEREEAVHRSSADVRTALNSADTLEDLAAVETGG